MGAASAGPATSIPHSRNDNRQKASGATPIRTAACSMAVQGVTAPLLIGRR